MATKKKIQAPNDAAAAVAQAAPPKISLPPMEMVKMIVKKALADPMRGRICLISKPRTGKSWFVVNELASELVAAGILKEPAVLTCYPQVFLAEEMAGAPRVQGKNLIWTNPGFIPPEFVERKKDYILFIDEADKCREENQSTLLSTLSWESRIHDFKLEPYGMMIAMNPPERKLIEALVERLLFVQFPPVGFDYCSRPDLSVLREVLDGILPPVRSEDTAFPARATTPGAAHILSAWRKDYDFWRHEELRHTVVHGLFPPKDAALILSRMQRDFTVDPIEWAQTCTPMELMEGFIPVLRSLDLKDERRHRIMEAFQTRANADATGELHHALELLGESAEVGMAVWSKGTGEDVSQGKQSVDNLLKKFEEDRVAGDEAPKEAK